MYQFPYISVAGHWTIEEREMGDKFMLEGEQRIKPC